MVTTIVSTTAQLSSMMDTHSGGDTLLLAGGIYSKLTKTDKVYASDLIIKAQTPSNPPVFNDQGMNLLRCSHIKLDGIVFQGTAVESTKGGVQYPLTGNIKNQEALVCESCSYITLRNCRVTFYMNGIRFQKCPSNMTIERCTIRQIQVDPIMVYGGSDYYSCLFNAIYDFRIDSSRRNEYNRHPDGGGQIRPNRGEVTGGNPMDYATIEGNYVDDPTGYAKGIFCNTEGTTPGVGFRWLTIKDNEINIGRYSGIEITGPQNLSCTGNRCRRYNAGVGETPALEISFVGSGTISNNVWPRNPRFTDGAAANQYTMSNNTTSTTANPTGWVDKVPGVNCGAYSDGDPETPVGPTQPTIEGSHGRFANYEAVPLNAGYYAPVLIVQKTAPAFMALSESSANGRWIRDGISTPKPFEYADPKFNAAGSLRLRCKGGSGGLLSVYSATPGQSLNDLAWEWTEGTSWSGMSTYTADITIPAPEEPPPDDPVIGDFDPTDSRLRWEPPRQTAPTIITLPAGYFANKTSSWTNTSGNGRANGPRVFADDEDVIILGAGAAGNSGSQTEIEGGRHVRMLSAHRLGRIMWKEQTGSVYMEGCEIVLDAVASDQDAISIGGKAGYQPDFFLQNCLVTGVQGTNAGLHGDIFQLQGPVGKVCIDKLTGNTNYQGIFIRPEFLINEAYLSRIDLTFNDLDTPDNNTYLLWMRNPSGQTAPGNLLYPIQLTAIYLAQHESRTPIQAAVYPTNETIQGFTGAVATPNASGHVVYNQAGIAGVVRNGAPPAGSYVVGADVGVGYVPKTDFQIMQPPVEPPPEPEEPEPEPVIPDPYALGPSEWRVENARETDRYLHTAQFSIQGDITPHITGVQWKKVGTSEWKPAPKVSDTMWELGDTDGGEANSILAGQSLSFTIRFATNSVYGPESLSFKGFTILSGGLAYTSNSSKDNDMIASGEFNITPGEPLPEKAYGVYVGGAGNLVYTPATGDASIIKAVLAGSYHPVEISDVGAGTTATGIIGLRAPSSKGMALKFERL